MNQSGKWNKSKWLKDEIEGLRRKKLVSQTVVQLEDYRLLQQENQPATILAVDDDEIMRKAIRRLLENEGHKVVLAEDAMAVSKLLETTALDLILLDINLPWVDGLELCTILKRHPSLSHVPLVLVSGRKSEEDVERGFEAGCDDYITKPFDVGVMARVVAKALGR